MGSNIRQSIIEAPVIENPVRTNIAQPQTNITMELDSLVGNDSNSFNYTSSLTESGAYPLSELAIPSNGEEESTMDEVYKSLFSWDDGWS
jgi:hypothetical protein